MIKAVRIGHAADLRDLERFHTEFHLLDTSQAGLYGGTGKTWDWKLVANRRNKIPLILFGGLTPENVADGIAAVKPWGVDVREWRRGVAGIKDPAKLDAFFAAVDAVEASAGDEATASADRRNGMSAVEHRFGPYGGQYVPETLVPALVELEAAWIVARDDPSYQAELTALLNDYVGRPSPLYLAQRVSDAVGHPVYLKREDLNHTGAHKINNALGQALLAKRMGKTRIIAETGAGSHGVAIATACALLDLDCYVYMGTEDMRRQAPNVQRMGLLGTTVVPVEAGARTLKEAVSAAIRDWVANVATTHYAIGSCVGPAPFPALVRDLQRIIGDEARAQILAKTGALPEPRDRVRRRRLERDRHLRALPRRRRRRDRRRRGGGGGDRLRAPRRAADASAGAAACCTAPSARSCRTRTARSSRRTRSRAGLDYPGTGPEHAYLRDTGRARYVAVTDDEALERLPAARRARGHHPRARIRPRRRVGARPRRGGGDGGHRRPDLPVGAWRQGPGRGARQARHRVSEPGNRWRGTEPGIRTFRGWRG